MIFKRAILFHQHLSVSVRYKRGIIFQNICIGYPMGYLTFQQCMMSTLVNSPQHKVCLHGKRYQYCSECGGSQMCEHGRRRAYCRDCGGSQICVHARIKSQCRDCGGTAICPHNRISKDCDICSSRGKRSRKKECLSTWSISGLLLRLRRQ